MKFFPTIKLQRQERGRTECAEGGKQGQGGRGERQDRNRQGTGRGTGTAHQRRRRSLLQPRRGTIADAFWVCLRRQCGYSAATVAACFCLLSFFSLSTP